MKYALLTGATGFLGSFILRDLVSAGRPVAVLARASAGSSAAERVFLTLARTPGGGELSTDQIKVFEGTLDQPGLGLSPEDQEWIGTNCDTLIHCAGSLQFHARDGEPYRTNVDGTRFLLELCRQADIRTAHLVSTAYVCGDRDGSIFEDQLDTNQRFRNDYERSKYLSERLFHDASHLESCTVFRPSVVVGDSDTGYASSKDGLYALLRLASALGPDLDEETALANLGMTREMGLNLVPVDWVAASILALISRPEDGQFRTYHLTNPVPTRVGAIMDHASCSPLAKSAPLGRHAAELILATYAGYLSDHPDFDSSHRDRDAPKLPCPELDSTLLERLITSFEGNDGGPAQHGGTFQVALHVPAMAAQTLTGGSVPGPENPFAVHIHCAAATLDQLRAGTLDVPGAVRRGLVFVEGSSENMAEALELFDDWLESTPAPSASMVQEAAS